MVTSACDADWGQVGLNSYSGSFCAHTASVAGIDASKTLRLCCSSMCAPCSATTARKWSHPVACPPASVSQGGWASTAPSLWPHGAIVASLTGSTTSVSVTHCGPARWVVQLQGAQQPTRWASRAAPALLCLVGLNSLPRSLLIVAHPSPSSSHRALVAGVRHLHVHARVCGTKCTGL